MQDKPPKNLALDNTVPPKGPSVGVRRRPQQKFPEVGQTLSTYRYDAFNNQPPARKKPSRFSRLRGMSKKKLTILILLPFIIIGLWLGIKFGYNAGRIFKGNVFSILTTSKLKGESEGRVNILVAGNSADDIGHNGGNLTDSIMIVSIDTRNNKAVLLSVPRDLYVDIDGYGHGKINEAYVAGESQKFSEDGYADGGMGLLEKTIEESLGIKSQYYALVNYSALRDMVNAVGGIDVSIQSNDPRGLYDPSKDYATGGILVKLSNGVHHLTGEQALDLARARGDARGSYGYSNSDFTRTANQRMMMLSLKTKVTSSGVLANPVKLSSLSDAAGSNVKSDLKLSEVRRVSDIMKKIGNGRVASAGLNDLGGSNYLTTYRTKTGQSALAPSAGVDDYSDIQGAIRRLFSSNQTVTENAKVVVLNASDAFGVASAAREKLAAKFVNVVAIADAKDTQTTSQIIDVSGGTAPQTLATLKGIYGNSVLTSSPYTRSYPSADFIVLVGNDHKSTGTSTPQVSN